MQRLYRNGINNEIIATTDWGDGGVMSKEKTEFEKWQEEAQKEVDKMLEENKEKQKEE